MTEQTPTFEEITEAEFQHDMEYYLDQCETNRAVFLIVREDGTKFIAAPMDMVGTKDDSVSEDSV